MVSYLGRALSALLRGELVLAYTIAKEAFSAPDASSGAPALTIDSSMPAYSLISGSSPISNYSSMANTKTNSVCVGSININSNTNLSQDQVSGYFNTAVENFWLNKVACSDPRV